MTLPGRLPVGDGHVLAYDLRGAADAPCALILHGGPGSGIAQAHWHLFDPASWRVAAFDQRGCGASRPLAAEDTAALSVQSLADHIADIEALRTHLGIARWCVFGGSWGATLAQAYAHVHPARVTGLVLAGVTSTRPD